MSEFRWKLRHPDKGSAIEEWVLARRPDGTMSFAWTQYVVRWFPKLKRWRVQEMVRTGTTRTGQEYLKRVTLAEFPCDNLVMAYVGEEARAFAETTWRLKHGE